MNVAQQVAALGRLDGVKEATLCRLDGTLIESSNAAPSLVAAASTIGAAVRALQGNLAELDSPVSLTIEGESGAIHLFQSSDSMLILATTGAANLGAVRLEVRAALDAIDNGRGA
jgi:predicted regulator of Ras-like GTPase activity (Roadblock/LC7/MglB family)